MGSIRKRLALTGVRPRYRTHCTTRYQTREGRNFRFSMESLLVRGAHLYCNGRVREGTQYVYDYTTRFQGLARKKKQKEVRDGNRDFWRHAKSPSWVYFPEHLKDLLRRRGAL